MTETLGTEPWLVIIDMQTIFSQSNENQLAAQHILNGYAPLIDVKDHQELLKG